ncbi:structural protein [Lactococcus phage P087]|uniref:Structural protein n=1 Tax=Lactococcus phage P087 TaxID=641487 RepID=C3U2S6_9CAUD|nr:virion structural protein [Lactococcus phage P087]ACP41762.1 structural protein [Lactococcus phage P087]
MSNTAPFLHIAYANNDTGTLDFTTTGGIERTYTGFYTDEYSTDSSDPTKYKWLTNAEFKNKVNTAAYANSADGITDFTTVYPNLNLLSGTSTKVVQATSWNMKVADIKYDKSLGGALCASVMINNADQASVLGRGSAKIVLQTLDKSGNVLASTGGGSIRYNANGLSWCSISIDDNTASIKVYIMTNNMNQNAFYSRLKIEKGTIATPYMKSASEVKDSDYPKYIGFSNVTNPTTFKDYEWTLLENIPKKILNTHVAYANSADGITDFTTVYPNLNLLKGTRTLTATSNSSWWNTLFSSEQIYDSAIKSKTGVSAMNFSFDVFVPLNAKVGGAISLQLKGQNSQALNIGSDEWNTLIAWVGYVIKQSDLGKTIRVNAPVNLDKEHTKYQSFDSALADTDSITIRQGSDTSGLVYSKLKLEIGSTATPHMPSESEVQPSDYPKFVGVYGDDSTTASQVPAAYKWSSIAVPGPTPPTIPNLYILTMPTVKSINLTYGIGTLTTKPTNWLSAKPKLDVNQVLWYKSEITGTDNSVGVYYSNLIGGANLDDGDSPLDNTVVSIVLNNKIVNVPRDLALKLELLSQTLNKRDNELAQLIANTNDRISNIDLGSGQAGLNREILDRQNGDDSLGVRIDTVTGDVNDLKNNTQTKFTNIEKQLGGFSVQGTKNNSLTRPSIVFDYNAYGAILSDGSTDGGGRLYYQVPGDTTYAVRELKFNYQTLPSFYDRDQIMIWEDSWSKLYGGFPWRDTIVTTTDIDKFYIDGMTTYYDYNGDLVIRGRVVLDGIDDWIGSMTNRGFKPDTVVITVASDLKSVKSIRFTGEMGVIDMSMSLGYSTVAQVQRIGRQVSFCGSSPLGAFSTTGVSWTNLNDKIPYGLRPTRSFEFAVSTFGNNNSIQYAFDSNGGIKLHQSINNANQYQVMGQVSWQTFDQYPPIGYASKPDWINR